jgi:hypothetical protein
MVRAGCHREERPVYDGLVSTSTDVEALAQLEKRGATVSWPSRQQLTVEELRTLGAPLRGLEAEVMRELEDGRA